MFKDVLQGIEQNSWYSVAAMVLMIVAFLTIIVRVVLMDRRHVDHMGHLPLDGASAHEQNGEDCHV